MDYTVIAAMDSVGQQMAKIVSSAWSLIWFAKDSQKAIWLMEKEMSAGKTTKAILFAE